MSESVMSAALLCTADSDTWDRDGEDGGGNDSENPDDGKKEDEGLLSICDAELRCMRDRARGFVYLD